MYCLSVLVLTGHFVTLLAKRRTSYALAPSRTHYITNPSLPTSLGRHPFQRPPTPARQAPPPRSSESSLQLDVSPKPPPPPVLQRLPQSHPHRRSPNTQCCIHHTTLLQLWSPSLARHLLPRRLHASPRHLVGVTRPRLQPPRETTP